MMAVRSEAKNSYASPLVPKVYGAEYRLPSCMKRALYLSERNFSISPQFLDRDIYHKPSSNFPHSFQVKKCHSVKVSE